MELARSKHQHRKASNNMTAIITAIINIFILLLLCMICTVTHNSTWIWWNGKCSTTWYLLLWNKGSRLYFSHDSIFVFSRPRIYGFFQIQGILKLPLVIRHHSFSALRGSHRAALSERKFHYPSYYLRNQNRPTVLFWLSLSLCCALSYLRWMCFTDKVMAAYHRLAPNSCFVFEYRICTFQGSMESLFSLPTYKPIKSAFGYLPSVPIHQNSHFF